MSQYCILKKLSSFHLVVFAPLSKTNFSYASGSLFGSVGLMSILKPIPYSLDYHRFKISIEIRWYYSANIFLFQNALHFHRDFRIILSISTKKDCWYFDWDLEVNMERTDMLTILNLLAYEQCILFQLFRPLFSHSTDMRFSVYWSYTYS